MRNWQTAPPNGKPVPLRNCTTDTSHDGMSVPEDENGLFARFVPVSRGSECRVTGRNPADEGARPTSEGPAWPAGHRARTGQPDRRRPDPRPAWRPHFGGRSGDRRQAGPGSDHRIRREAVPSRDSGTAPRCGSEAGGACPSPTTVAHRFGASTLERVSHRARSPRTTIDWPARSNRQECPDFRGTPVERVSSVWPALRDDDLSLHSLVKGTDIVELTGGREGQLERIRVDDRCAEESGIRVGRSVVRVSALG